MFHDLIRAGTKPTSSAEWSRHRADNHVDFGSVYVLVLCNASTGPAQDAEGPCLVKDEAEFVFELEFDLEGSVRRCIQGVEMFATDNFRQVNHITNILKQALGDNEPPRQRLLRLFFRNFRQNPLQVLHIIVLIPSYCTPRDLEPFLDRIVHRFIRNDDISSFRESRNNTRYRRKGLGVNNASRRP
jgi:hypothetical protein